MSSFLRLTLLLLVCAYAQLGSAQEAESAAPVPPAAPEATSTIEPGEYDVFLVKRESRLTVGGYGQMSQFSRDGEGLMGYTFEGLVSYALTNKVAAQFAINQAVDMKGGISVLFTGLRTSLAYAFYGNFISTHNTLTVNNRQTMNVRTGDKPLLAAEAGVDQYMFNGDSRIVPATGVSAGARYDRDFWGLRFSLVARYGMLVITEIPSSMMTLGAGVLLRF